MRTSRRLKPTTPKRGKPARAARHHPKHLGGSEVLYALFAVGLLWRGCGTSHVRQREIWHDSLVQSPPPPSGRPLTPQWKHAFAVFSGSLHNPGGAIHGDDLPVPK